MSKKKKLWIIIPSVVVFIALSATAALYFYFIYYLKPNFEDAVFNRISSNNSGILEPDDEIQYTIDYKNTGNTDVTGFIITTGIPANTEYIRSNPEAKNNTDTGTIEFFIPVLEKNAAGSVAFTVKVANPLDNKTVIRTSEVLFEYIARKEPGNFKISETLSNEVESSPDFSGLKLSFRDMNGGKISMGDRIKFDISINNSGNMNAKNIKVTDILPDKFILDKSSIKSEAEISQDKNQLVWQIDTLNVGESMDFSFIAAIDNGFEHLEIFKNTVTVEYDGQITNEASVSDKVWGFPNFSQSVNSVADTDGGSVWAGDILKYTIIVKNSGLRAGENFKLICPIPASTTYSQGSASDAENASYDSEAKTLSWDIESLEVGDEKSFEFSAKISGSLIKGGNITSAFYIEGDQQFVELEPVSIGVRSYIFQTLVCMGDSQITRTNWPANLDYLLESSYIHAEYNTIASGVPQQLAYQGAKRYDSTVAVYNPSIVVIGYGTNDAGTSTSNFREGMTQIIQKAKANGTTPVVHSIGWIDTGLHPNKKGYQDYNAILRDVCAKNGVPYVDILGPMSSDPGRYVGPDGLHWTSDGAGLVANLVFNTIRNYLDSEGNRT